MTPFDLSSIKATIGWRVSTKAQKKLRAYFPHGYCITPLNSP